MLVFIALVAVGRIVLFLALNAQERQANQYQAQAAAIIQQVFELAIVALDYRIYLEERPFVQTSRKLTELARRIGALPDAHPHFRDTVADLSRDFRELRDVYARLVVLHTDQPTASEPRPKAVPGAFGQPDIQRFRLATLISAEANDLMGNARRLLALSTARVQQLATLSRNLSFGFDLLMVLLIFAILSALRGNLLRSLSALRQGTLALAGGDLGARVVSTKRDELGELATAFNTMAGQLAQRQQQLEALHGHLRALNADLEQRVALRTAELTDEAARRQQAIVELTQSNEELRQFAYVASHDLQEPLRMVSSYSDLLQRRFGPQFDAEGLRYLDYITEGARRMQGLILALLSYSRIATTGAPFGATPLAEPLAEALANLRLSITETGAIIDQSPLPTLWADRGQLVQLFQNLIGNALKFRGDAPPHIAISAQREGETWRVSVRDNGIGIAPEHHEQIFTIFQRLHSRAQYPGTGIGLAVCRRIAERHGGEIRVESTPGAGATFHVTLPINPVVEPTAP